MITIQDIEEDAFDELDQTGMDIFFDVLHDFVPCPKCRRALMRKVRIALNAHLKENEKNDGKVRAALIAQAKENEIPCPSKSP